jgi:hypothetical protein
MERKYMWWRPVGGGLHAKNRILAQVMNLGTYDDIRRLEQTFGRAALAEIIRSAAPGWFTPRAWEFWRGRLAVAGIEITEAPPQRSFGAEPS